MLLEHGFEVALMLFGVGVVEQRADESEDEIAGGVVSAVEIDRGDERFDGGGFAGAGESALGDHPFTDVEELEEFQIVGESGAGASGDDHAFNFGEFSFEVIWEAGVEFLADNRPEDGVAEEFESFVTAEAIVGDRSVGEGLFEQIDVGKLIPDGFLALLEGRIIVAHFFAVAIRRSRTERALISIDKPLPSWANGLTASNTESSARSESETAFRID